MIKRSFSLFWRSAALTSIFMLSSPGLTIAQSATSTNYKVSQTQFGTGSSLSDCSANYCGRVSIGDTASGSGTSTNFRAQFGADTSSVPLLEVITTGGSNNLGTLTTASTATITESIKIRSYLSNGYTVQMEGTPPSQGVHQLDSLTAPTTSQPGIEQFGINLVANTTPNIGANPVEVPSTATSFGQPTTDYDEPNYFKYVEGDTIASSPTSSGETDYTLSMIFNVSNVTPGGNYTNNYSIVVLPVY
jgi:hypothetical protein